MPISDPLQTELGRFEEARKQLDTVLSVFPDHGDFDIYDALNISNLDKDTRRKILDCQEEITRMLIDLDYANPHKENSSVICLTKPGRKAKQLGGHTAYVKYQNEQEEIKRKKEVIDLQNAERVYKSYWSTRFIAWFAFGLTVILIILRLVELIKLLPVKK